MSQAEGVNKVGISNRWKRNALYLLAMVGLIALVFVGVALFTSKTRDTIHFDEAEVIDTIMSRTYGKYSEQRKGWLYVGRQNEVYLMRVVQQAKIAEEGQSDELYFVASGTPSNRNASALYGVFHVHSSTDSKKVELVETSSALRYEGSEPLTPERIRFEALNAKTWGWMIKVQNGKQPKNEGIRVNNVLLAPHGDEIALLATFNASIETDPGIDCKEANRLYDEWAQPNSASIHADSGEEPIKKTELDAVDETPEPLRCNKARWTYRTDGIAGDAFTPLYITPKGIKNGLALEEKTKKVMFDQKSYSYPIPEDLTPE